MGVDFVGVELMGRDASLINALSGRDAPSKSEWQNPISSSLFLRVCEAIGVA